jgi:hypothetical protein
VAIALLAVVLAGAVFGTSPASAAAKCTCAKPNPSGAVATYADQAKVVFSGTLNDVRLAPKLPNVKRGTPRPLRYVLAVEKVYKGSLPSSNAQVTAKKTTSACELGKLPVGKRYVFFVGLVEDAPVVNGKCSGTQPLTASVLTELGTVFPPPPTPAPKPTTATRTKVDDSSPIEFTRLAAPGAALIILGALGLAVVGRLGRE